MNINTARRFFLERDGNYCSLCGGKEWNGKKMPLVLDHKNGNSGDWSLKNLRLLCCNCDAQTETYKGRNRGNGRYSRRQRYTEGKSF